MQLLEVYCNHVPKGLTSLKMLCMPPFFLCGEAFRCLVLDILDGPYYRAYLSLPEPFVEGTLKVNWVQNNFKRILNRKYCTPTFAITCSLSMGTVKRVFCSSCVVCGVSQIFSFWQWRKCHL